MVTMWNKVGKGPRANGGRTQVVASIKVSVSLQDIKEFVHVLVLVDWNTFTRTDRCYRKPRLPRDGKGLQELFFGNGNPRLWVNVRGISEWEIFHVPNRTCCYER